MRQKRQSTNRPNLATYLGIHHRGRFRRKRPGIKPPADYRRRLLFVALALLALGLWGVWRELM